MEPPKPKTDNTSEKGAPEKLDGLDEGKDLVACQAELVKAASEREEYLNGWKRAKADLINYKKDEAARAENLIRFSNESILQDLIQVMDSFDLALSVNPNKDGSDRGLLLIKSQFENFLRQNGMEAINIAGEMFNPAFHEAIIEEESDKPPGMILEEVGRGWKLHGKVIRPTRVKIAKQKTS